MKVPQPEVWQCGPITNIPALLQPVAHALLQAKNEVQDMMDDFPSNALWQKPAGVASPAFHLLHLSGVLDRVFTYARGETLNEEQLLFLSNEGKEDDTVTVSRLVTLFDEQVVKALSQLETTEESTLTETRYVGRKQIPSTVIGLLFHAAEHTMRHTGQLYVTVKVITADK